ncbi:MAG: hypothetical protein COB37_03295 [Kordiimonadales bacterium]|nr:MAG: hypothetical protein COB37_03295 [Kordiimonadales bacterium]
MSKANLQKWYDFVEKHDTKALSDMLADDVVFHSPVVHTPQEGKAITFLYLSAAGKVLSGDNFAYVGEYLSENGAVIEFNTVIDGIRIDGIDMITWNDEGKIIEFKVMLRPLKAVNKVHEMMGAMLAKA